MEWLGLSVPQFLTALLGFGGAVIALYLLKQQHRRVSVPALALWEAVLKSREQAALARRLKSVLSLLLALCIVLALLFALADLRPAWTGASRHVVILVDRSASMSAKDAAPNRLAAAKRAAQELVRSLTPKDRAMVVALDAKAMPLSSWSGDSSELLRALADIQPSELSSDLEAGTRLALDSLHGLEGPEIALFTDGAVQGAKLAAQRLAKVPQVHVSEQRVGSTTRNVAIRSFSVRRYPLDVTHQECLVSVASFAPEPERVTLTLQAQDTPLHEETFTLAPGGQVTRALTDLPGSESQLTARISLSAGADVLPADDVAFAVLPPRTRTRVLVVSPGNRYLEAALLLDEYLDVRELTPAAYQDAQGFDVVIFDRVRPAREPTVPALYLAGDLEAGYFPLAVEGTVQRPYFERVDGAHPVVRLTALRDVNIAKALRVKVLPEDHVIAATEQRSPLLVEGTRAARFMALTFDVRESDLTLRPAWPLLLLRSIEHLRGERAGAGANNLAGEALQVALGSDANQLELLAPDGRRTMLAADAGKASFVVERAGFYTVSAGAAQQSLAVNMPAERESNLVPVPPFAASGRAASAPSARAEAWLGERPWPWFAALALLLLAVEWLTFHRRWTV